MKRSIRKAQVGLFVTMAICALLYMLKSYLNSREYDGDDYIESGNRVSLLDESRNGFVFEYNTSSTSKTLLDINSKKVAIYLNYVDSYECPYYTDRADMIAPEINRVAQMMRAFGMPIIFYTHTVEESEALKEAPQVKHFMEMEKEKPKDQSILKLDQTSPLFEEKCLFSDFNDNPAPCDGTIHHDIKYSTKQDYFVTSHEHGVALAKKLGVDYVIVAGMECNFWLPPFFEALKNEGIKPIYMYDLSDVKYWRKTQVSKFPSHTDALVHFWNWVVNNYGAIVNHFSLIDRLMPKEIPYTDFEFDGNKNAYYFEEYFGKDL